MDAPALQSGAAMSINTGLLVICAAVFTLVAGSLYVVSRALDTEGDIVRAEARRYSSYKLADELRQSSDDLTRMARLYVVTGDARYRSHFDRILAIRDGRAPRPLDYGNVYWDFAVAWGKLCCRVGRHPLRWGERRRLPRPLCLLSSKLFRQGFVSLECDEHPAPHAVEICGPECFVFSTDYPHYDTTYPEATARFLTLPLDEKAKRTILWDNCARLYGFPRD
jgi:hypothetical protein